MEQKRINLPRNSQIILGCNIIIFLIGAFGLLGYLLHLPQLYNWELPWRAPPMLPMSKQSAIMLLLLPFGGGLTLLWVNFHKKYFQIAAGVCFIGLMFIGVEALFLILTTSRQTDLLSVVLSSNWRYLSLYTAVGFILASLGSLALLFSPQESKLKHLGWIFGVLLTTLALFGFMEEFSTNVFFHYTISPPASLALLCYGLTLLFLPGPNDFDLIQILFHSRHSAGMGPILLFLAWLGSVYWQGAATNRYYPFSKLTLSLIYSPPAVDEYGEILISSIILGCGIYILSILKANIRLTEKVKQHFEDYSLLAATLSHDLKAPIQTEISAIDLVKEGHLGDALSEKSRRLLAAVNENNQFELELVLNLVDLLRYDLKEERFNPEPIAVEALLREVEEELAPLAIRKNQELTVHREIPDSQTITIDYMGIKRVLHNLLNNAIQHLESHHHIDLTVEPLNDSLLFSVKDNGPGISPQQQESLFKRFGRNQEGQEKQPSSSGLGLYITKRIIDRHHGKIWVKSAPNQGTCVQFTLPL